MEEKLFGRLKDGRDVLAYTMKNSLISVTILNYGGSIQSLLIGGRDIICGFDKIEDYEFDDSYQGAVVGRYANRIKNADFTLHGVRYALAKNDRGKHHLHGGNEGFNRKLWQSEGHTLAEHEELVLTYASPDMEEGYPGRLCVTVTYALYKDALEIHYQAVADKDTYVNLTNHAYINLNGYDGETIENHLLKINADKFTAVDAERIPLGYLIDVENTPFDFRKPKLIGQDINTPNEQMGPIGGYGHNFWINNAETLDFEGRKLKVHADMSSNGIGMRICSTMPCNQFYTANILNGITPFKGGVKQHKRAAVCLEPQYEPDSPSYEKTILKAGEKYDHITLYKFAIIK